MIKGSNPESLPRAGPPHIQPQDRAASPVPEVDLEPLHRLQGHPGSLCQGLEAIEQIEGEAHGVLQIGLALASFKPRRRSEVKGDLPRPGKRASRP